MSDAFIYDICNVYACVIHRMRVRYTPKRVLHMFMCGFVMHAYVWLRISQHFRRCVVGETISRSLCLSRCAVSLPGSPMPEARYLCWLWCLPAALRIPREQTHDPGCVDISNQDIFDYHVFLNVFLCL